MSAIPTSTNAKSQLAFGYSAKPMRGASTEIRHPERTALFMWTGHLVGPCPGIIAFSELVLFHQQSSIGSVNACSCAFGLASLYYSSDAAIAFYREWLPQMNWQKQSFSQRLKNAVLVVPVVLFLPFILPLVLLAIIFHILYRTTLYLLVWVIWLPRGKDILFVYSDSPIWHEYMATQILPLVQDRAVVLNWSECV